MKKSSINNKFLTISGHGKFGLGHPSPNNILQIKESIVTFNGEVKISPPTTSKPGGHIRTYQPNSLIVVS